VREPAARIGDNRAVTFLDAAARQAEALQTTAHRPWPVPDSPWSQAQTRTDVLFAHWRVGLDEIARLLPPDLPVDTHEGDAWLGLVPFRLANLRLRGLPPVPRLTFEQLDIRTYVTLDGRPGVWLCSIDVSNPVLLEAAKRTHRLPAYRARMSAGRDGDVRTAEVDRDGLSFVARYRPAGETFTAESGSLEHFLTERYCIYTADGGRLYRAELHHAPWRLQAAAATISASTLAPVALDGEPHAMYAAAQDVLVWPLEEL
jgi:uncharacterized protein YqjF (DUF2071 family)